MKKKRESYQKKKDTYIFNNSNLLILDKNIDIFEYIKKRNRRNLWKLSRRHLHMIRYFFISHKSNHSIKKFVVYIIESVLIMIDAV